MKTAIERPGDRMVEVELAAARRRSGLRRFVEAAPRRTLSMVARGARGEGTPAPPASFIRRSPLAPAGTARAKSGRTMPASSGCRG